MNTQHANLSCCSAKVIRFGRRRRQCTRCLKTWRIRKKRRGRKRKRINGTLVISYLTHAVPPVSTLARQRGLPVSTAKYHLAISLKMFLKKNQWPVVANTGQMIAVADAWTKKLKGAYHTWYVILLRPIADNQAVLLPLQHYPGRESAAGWQKAFDAVPKEILTRIAALVADGHQGLVNEAKWRNWLLQRCNFHLIAAIQGRRSRWKASRHHKEGEYLYQLVLKVLSTRKLDDLSKVIVEIESFGWQTKSRQLRRILLGFVNHVDDYRTYLNYPELNLPRTSNTAEAFFSLAERLCHRARGFASVDSLSNWLDALVKHRKTITCNGNTNRIN